MLEYECREQRNRYRRAGMEGIGIQEPEELKEKGSRSIP